MYITENNLIPLNIEFKQGQRCIKIGNSVIPVGVGGAFLPGSASDSSFAGLQVGVLVEDNGLLKVQPLSFEGTQAYSSDSLQQGQLKIFNTSMSEPDYGGSGGSGMDPSLIFYAPLSSFQVAAKTGQGLQINGTPSYSSYSGINSVLFSTSSTYLKTIVGIQSSAEVSISLWLYLSSQAGQSGGDYPRFLCLGSSSTADNASDWLCLTYNVSGQEFTFQAPDNNTWTTSAASAVKDQWVHLACVYSQGTLTLYVNGAAQTGATVVNALNLPTGSTLYINYINSQYNAGVDGSRMAALRIYNRVLSSTQITALSQEFTPTA